ncbi:MAG: class I mannose-6-phosphate isomerase [Muribaculaceae bacterium]|nr:class I mannose-6-phosphate isomerase [Muribaculaceae bacterium]
MIKKEPIRFAPYLKSVIWGGEKICRYKGISQTEPNIGESWEISEVQGHESIVSEGSYKGMLITELIEKFGSELVGKNVMTRYGGKFPLLVKLIDAKDNLSVQVHPDDALAMARHGSRGKSEMWYIIEAENNAKIYSGLNRQMTPEEYVKRVLDNTIEETLAIHDSHPGDVYFLPAGRVHSIGAGNLLAEIQESSDITYRIYDYARRDADGNTRELHTDLAKDAIDYTYYKDYRSATPDHAKDDVKIAECDHFTVYRLMIDGEKQFAYDDSSFTVLMCLEGEVKIKYDNGDMTLNRGETVLLPAVMNSFALDGQATLLAARS